MDIALIMDRLRPGAKWRMSGNYKQLVDTWEDKDPPPTEEEIKAEWEVYENELEGIREANTAEKDLETKRSEFIDALMEDDQEQIQTIRAEVIILKDKIKAVRN